jgi:hypothetical protein
MAYNFSHHRGESKPSKQLINDCGEVDQYYNDEEMDIEAKAGRHFEDISSQPVLYQQTWGDESVNGLFYGYNTVLEHTSSFQAPAAPETFAQLNGNLHPGSHGYRKLSMTPSAQSQVLSESTGQVYQYVLWLWQGLEWMY